jgi:hypothetical protein
VELSVLRTGIGVQERLQGVPDREPVVEVRDAPPPEFGVDERLGGDRAVLAGERTQRPDAGESGGDREPNRVCSSPSAS